MSVPADLTQRFLLEHLDIRGQVVRLGPLWRTLLSRHPYPESLRQLLGEFASVAVLVGSGLKHPGRAVLQVIGQGPIAMAVSDCTQELALRAMLRPGARFADLPAGGADATVHDHFPAGRLALTIENTASARHFQSVVPLEGATLAECFERYFDRSEQVPTHLWVHVTAERAGALILQKLPGADEKDLSGWARIQQLAAREAPFLLDRGPDDVAALLAALFPEDDVRLFRPQAVRDGCSRSEEKVVAMLRGLGRAEVEATLAEHGVVRVHDEICNQEYTFTAADVERIFAG
jgi:molecular chaperone Hsp33